ncbi:MAG: DUF2924 domain-containing protein [Pseudomonadota bacterium]
MPRLPRTANREAIECEIERLKSLELGNLRTEWRVAFKQEGKGLSRDLLFKMLVWKTQERSFGGYGTATEKALNRYVKGGGDKAEVGNASRCIRPGAILVREYQGSRHSVMVVAEGFVWRERTYSNLSKIAKEITGVNWNGPRFFGLRQSKLLKKADQQVSA